MTLDIDNELILWYACGAVSFILYAFIANAASTKRAFEKRWGGNYTLYHVPFARIAGGALMGIIPLAVMKLSDPDHTIITGWALREDQLLTTVIWIIVLAIPAVAGAWLQSKQKNHRKSYPEIRVVLWRPKIIFIHIISWGIYLMGYETLFRGYFILDVVGQMGFWPAATISTVLYATAHYNKGWGQILGAVPYGLLLCLITWHTGMIWVAFAAHFVMAISNGLFSVRHSATMHYINE